MADSTKSSRRDFLRGTSAAHALADAIAGPPAELPPRSIGVEAGSHLLSVSREAMACLFEIVLDAATYRDKTDVAVEALDLVERLENQLTVYRDTSEVAAINRRAADEPVVIEHGLFNLLKRAEALSHATGGAFDVTAGPFSKLWGFYRRQGQMPSAEEICQALATVGWLYLELDDAVLSVRFLRPGMELNLGAIGKGYALDRAADALLAGGISDFLIHGGNSSVLARGRRIADCKLQIADSSPDSQSAICNPQSAISTGWSVALCHPLKPGLRLAEFVLRDQALGTSGSGTQFFHYQGKRYSHIIDPRSGWPADKVLSATVIAPTAEQADALSTAFYVMGIEGAADYCHTHDDISALLVTAGSEAGALQLQPINLSEHRWRRL